MNPTAQVIKRRRVPRREFSRRVGLLVRGTYQISRALQIGEGGMMVYSVEPLKIGQSLVMSFKLPGEPTVVVRGVVRYILAAQLGLQVRYGVEFSNLDFNVKRAVRNYVAAKSAHEDALLPQ